MLFPPLIIHKILDRSNFLKQLLLLSLLNIVIPRKPAGTSIVLLLSALIIVVSIPPPKLLFTSSHLPTLLKFPSIHPSPVLICPPIHTFYPYLQRIGKLLTQKVLNNILYHQSFWQRCFNKNRRDLQ